MSEKTMRKWFKTFLMLLPFLFLAIFAIGVRKDGLKYEVESEPYEIYGIENQYDTFVPVEELINEDYIYISYTAADYYNAVLYDKIIVLGSFNNVGNTKVRYNLDEGVLEFTEYGTTNQWNSQLPQGFEEYFEEFYYEETLFATLEEIIEFGTDWIDMKNEIVISIYAVPTAALQNEQLIFNFDNGDTTPTVLKDRSQEPSYIEGPQAVLLHFNDMIEENFNINAFGMNDFYEWMNENWFNNNAPLIVKPVFTLLVYEAIIEIIFLMFSFITFVIRFAQQWIDGFYTKGGGK